MPPLTDTDGARRRLANLKPFQPGQSGNPAGRPRGRTFAAALRQQLEAVSPDDAGKTNAQRIAEKLVEMAIAGDIQAVRVILDRTEGKAPQVIHHEGNIDVTRLTDDELVAIVAGSYSAAQQQWEEQ